MARPQSPIQLRHRLGGGISIHSTSRGNRLHRGRNPPYNRKPSGGKPISQERVSFDADFIRKERHDVRSYTLSRPPQVPEEIGSLKRDRVGKEDGEQGRIGTETQRILRSSGSEDPRKMLLRRTFRTVVKTKGVPPKGKRFRLPPMAGRVA